jgi:hypothetical protein
MGQNVLAAPATPDYVGAAKQQGVKKMSFHEEARGKDAMADGDMVILTMPKEQCKYLENQYGKKCTSSTGNA